MGAISLELAQGKLQTWLDADDAIATGQSYELDIAGTKRKVTRADAAVVQERIKYWTRIVNRLEGRGNTAPSVRVFTPVDR